MKYILIIWLAGIDYPVMTIEYDNKEVCEDKALAVNVENSSFTANCRLNSPKWANN
jgi:hypothetical protein